MAGVALLVVGALAGSTVVDDLAVVAGVATVLAGVMAWRSGGSARRAERRAGSGRLEEMPGRRARQG
ncbi:MAG: hypothetical protein M0020_07960 [Actinomycetota bacterium]|nr:hypothetical protein [Actinomycetota bacterium]